MFEFDTTFDVNTGELEASYVGSGVHLYKDVTFSFGLIDPVGNVIENDAQMIANPLINEVIFDILDTGRNIIYPIYKSGVTSRSITITEVENENIFGKYTPNFGVRVTVTNHMGTDPFISEFYTYGNEPSVSSYKVYDASGLDDYSQSGFWKFNLNSSLLSGFQVKTASTGDVRIVWGDDPYDIIPDTIYSTGSGIIYYSSGLNFTRSNSDIVTAYVSGHGFISGDVVTITGITNAIDFNGTYPILNPTSGQFQYKTTGIGYATGSGFAGVRLTSGAHYYSGIFNPLYDQILINHTFENDFNYINIKKYDVYASETSLDEIILYESDKIPASKNKNFIFSSNRESINDLYELKVLPIGLKYDTPYYFKVVPYSDIGSGKVVSFGPSIFKSSLDGDEKITSSNQFELIHGDSSMNLDFITGAITTSDLSTMDIIERGAYNTILYTTQITDGNNTVYSSDLKIVDTYLSQTGSGVSLSEYAISSNSNVNYSIQNDSYYIYLKVSGVIPTATYKLYKTSI
jgi:hypothetical protein